ncbi:DNA polymerase Y family protein [Defluviimonas sp. WL0002]|uniref:DNA-directed DNA polymerase n=1 Tax=Albidovulum marisflavi TaxID=2984159 RepID=A0ABT2Z8N5_9RHOB|nr:DNA polymerase Y family protein [Defluviimonas sp. WL0002]MCV2867495.1 DNA polymerase Y family protein [Defluviimonas sp. WL0002]
MFDGITRRVVSMWFPRLASDRVLRLRPIEAPFALTLRRNNTERIHCLNARAEEMGLHRGMPFADARAFCPDLHSAPAHPARDARFLAMLRRWATRYCPWVGFEAEDGLVLDITGSAHLFGGETAMLGDMHARLTRAGLTVRLGLGATRGAAWAFAHFGGTAVHAGADRDALGRLPVAALRLEAETVTALERLGLRTIADLAAAPRAPVTRRFGPGVLMRLDQALGALPEQITPETEPPHYGVRLTLPEPIGLVGDVMAGAGRLVERLCARLKENAAGARVLCLTLRRVDQASQQVELRLASAMRDPARILPLFERGVGAADAGFGIDQMRLEATVIEPLAPEQLGAVPSRKGAGGDRLEDLITRIGTRIGLENVRRFLPADSHIPERGFLVAPAAWSRPEGAWTLLRPRPPILFRPEPIAGTGPRPPGQFRWRRMSFETAMATGPERIAPEWWLDDEGWRTGVRDYWHVQTRQGRRLWLFHTPQAPGWFVQGEFA